MDLNEIVFSKKYDGIWASFSIQHLEKKNQDLLFGKISKALNKKGIFYIGIHEGHKDYRDNLNRLYVPRTENGLRKVLKSFNLRILIYLEKRILVLITNQSLLCIYMLSMVCNLFLFVKKRKNIREIFTLTTLIQ